MRRSKLIASIIGGALLVGVGVGSLIDHRLSTAQEPKGGNGPPLDLSEQSVIDDGARLFRQTCTGYCHGKNGGAARAPKLRGQKLERSYVYARITKGSPNGMPAFEAALSQENIWKLVAYVLSLSGAEDK